MKCSYLDCESSKRTSSFVSYFSVPNGARRIIWMRHSGKKDPDDKKLYYCEKHFYTKDIIVRGTHKCLKKNAVPISNPSKSNCKCTENVFDKDCMLVLNSMLVEIKKPTKPGNKTIVDKALFCPTTDDSKKSVHNLIVSNALPKSTEAKINISKHSGGSSEFPSGSMNIDEQIQIASDEKKIQCLEAVIEYTSQMQKIVKQRGGLNSIIQANNHLIKLLDTTVYEWFQRAQKRVEIGVINDEMFIETALKTKKIFCIQNFEPNEEWLSKFKTNNKITDLDMRLLHIQNNSSPPSVEINEIILYVLRRNPLTNFFFTKIPKDCTISKKANDIEMKIQNDMEIPISAEDIETIMKTEDEEEFFRLEKEEDEDDNQMVVDRLAISSDEEARYHLKPIEEYVLLKDNVRAMALITELMDIFSTDKPNDDT
ncbi:uncharacterized protein LOC129947413 [Eupeodes corollae]|uniref:uncharacterized protein LOC129947413 n=1 Tax=Eupeodes corollae TaxID=290404 RepID=UPI00249244EF|nr:uncharacterized protein LOC129947413 [Eupeodes corollae]